MLKITDLLKSGQVLKDALLGVAFVFVGRLLPLLHPDARDLTGKTAIVTGGNSGVGYGIALQMAEMGAFVILACRNEKKAEKAKSDILSIYPSARVATLPLDNASLTSVRAFAKDWKYGDIDFVFHNAGISSCPPDNNFTEDGVEVMYQTNVLSSFLLTHLLEPHLSPTARTILTSSIGSYAGSLSDTFAVSKTQMKVELGFHSAPGLTKNDDMIRYGQTKLMQAAFARALQIRCDRDSGNKRSVYSFEPGLVRTNVFATRPPSLWEDPAGWLLASIMPYLGIDVRQGAATAVHLATSSTSAVLMNKGRYFDRMKPRAHKADIMSQAKLDHLWVRWCADIDVTWA